MGELTASIAHEINQPLAAVATNASASLQWLAVQPPNLAEAREAMESAMREADRASSVIKRIRMLLKKSSPELRPLRVNEVIREVLALSHNELLAGGITVQVRLSPDIPAVVGDRVQLQQVLLNLIVNAIDAMIVVTDRPRTLVVASAEDREGVRIEVEDSGKGLDPKQLNCIFESFFTTKPAGIGMGLSISRSIIEAHGGRLWACLLYTSVDINTIRAWLGHVSVDTTNVYAEVDLEMKAKALAACDTGGKGHERKMWRKNPRVMEFLRGI